MSRLCAALRKTMAPGLVAGMAGCSVAAGAAELTVSVGSLTAPGFEARDLKVRVAAGRSSSLEAQAREVSLLGRSRSAVRLTCPRLRVQGQRVSCADARLALGRVFPFSFEVDTRERAARLQLKPQPDESWRLEGVARDRAAAITLTVENGDLSLLAPWLPGSLPALGQGRANGTLRAQQSSSLLQMQAELELRGVSFSDQSGLHAGEQVGADVSLSARGDTRSLAWTGAVRWKAGEVFWQPFYLRAGATLEANGQITRDVVTVESGRLHVPEVAQAHFSLSYALPARQLARIELDCKVPDLAQAYAMFLQPVLAGTPGADLRVEGQAHLAAQWQGGTLRSALLELQHVSLEDKARRFALFGIDAQLPWRSDAPSAASLRTEGGEVLRIPLGAVDARLRTLPDGLQAQALDIPVLDGRLELRELKMTSGRDHLSWEVQGGLTPVSLTPLVLALGLPVMQGTLSGVIPRIRYEDGAVAVDGALLLKIFDGTVVIRGLQMLDPLGRIPRLRASIDMRNLDLALITRAFSFGSMTGRVDSTVQDLELANWRPVRFDARIESSHGEYPRTISQRAVQNISALGGVGAAAAIQRSFLRFFDLFRYARLGLACRLHNDVCEMSGIADRQYGYVIVEGGGLPAITVLGYNRHVGWSELLERLQRVTQSNVRPVVK